LQQFAYILKEEKCMNQVAGHLRFFLFFRGHCDIVYPGRRLHRWGWSPRGAGYLEEEVQSDPLPAAMLLLFICRDNDQFDWPNFGRVEECKQMLL